MSILDFTDENWQGEMGDMSRIIAIEQENYKDEPDKDTFSSVLSATVSSGDTLNSQTYRGNGASAPSPNNNDEVFLVTSGRMASKFQTSTGRANYTDVTITEALGSSGKFLGAITGAEADSASVNSEAMAKAYFDEQPSRYKRANTYYYFDGTDLKTITYTSDVSLMTRVATATEAGIYKYQTGLNPDSDVAARPNFIENPALSGNLTAKAHVLGQVDTIGTLYLPLTRSIHPYIRNILQSRGWNSAPADSDTILHTPAMPAGEIPTKVVAAATALDVSHISVGDITGATGSAPASLTVTLAGFSNSGANRDVAAGANGVISLVGKDHWNTTITEDILVPANAEATATFKSRYFWKNVEACTTSGFLAAGNGTFSITARDDSQKVVFKPYDKTMSSYLLLEFMKGRVPNLYRGMYASGATIRVTGANELLQLVIPMGGRKAALYENLAGTKVPEITESNKATFFDTDYASTPPADVEFISEPVMSGARTQVSLGVGAQRLPIININFDFGLRFDPSPVITGDPEELAPPIRRSRQPMLTGALQYSLATNLSLTALNAIQEDFVKIIFEDKAYGAFPDQHEITMRKTQFLETGDPAVRAGVTEQPFSMLGLPSTQGVVDDLSYSIFSPFAQDVRNYT